MRILITTDAWHPQINGVVRTLEHTAKALPDFGAEVEFLTPDRFPTVRLPSYPEIRVAFAFTRTVAAIFDRHGFDAIHIATEGPIGMAVRRVCLRRHLPFTTSYHTRFPEYVRARVPVPERWTYAWLRRFHNPSVATLVSTDGLRRELAARGFERLAIWTRGVDTVLFRPREESVLNLPRPIFLYVGRLAVEKNVNGFLDLDLPGTKVVVGDGPARTELEARYSNAKFLGLRTGDALAQVYASADIFVFPSVTDTYGIVLLEALASGLPIAAFPVPGPRDVVGDSGVGVLDRNLRVAALTALNIPSASCRAFALEHSWRRSAEQFLTNIMPISAVRRAAHTGGRGGVTSISRH